MAADTSGEEISTGDFEGGAMEDQADNSAPQTGGVASSGLPVLMEGRSFITSVSLSMSTSDVRRTTDDIRRVTSAAGGAIFSSDVVIDDVADDGSVPGGGQMVIKIEPTGLDALVSDLDGVGTVTRLAQDARDVTDQLVDLDIRIRQAESGITRIEALLAEAVVLDDVFVIERELNDRQVELEQLRASERNTENLVDLATLTVQIDYRTPTDLEELSEPDNGIGDAFSSGWSAFVGAVFAIGYVLAVTAPFLLTALLVLAIAGLLGRRWNRRHAENQEQRRLDADRRGDLARSSYPSAPPPPAADQRIPDGDTIVRPETETDDA